MRSCTRRRYRSSRTNLPTHLPSTTLQSLPAVREDPARIRPTLVASTFETRPRAASRGQCAAAGVVPARSRWPRPGFSDQVRARRRAFGSRSYRCQRRCSLLANPFSLRCLTLDVCFSVRIVSDLKKACSSLDCSKLSFEQNHVGGRGFDPGEYRSSLEAEVPIGEALAFQNAGLPGSRLRAIPSALFTQRLQLRFATDLRPKAKEGLAMPCLAN